MNQCPVCSRATNFAQRTFDLWRIQCDRCGTYDLSDSAAEATWPEMADFQVRASVSHAIRRMQAKDRKPPRIDSNLLSALIKTARLPPPTEQLNNLVIFLGHNLRAASDQYEFRWYELAGIMGAARVEQGVPYVLHQGAVEGLLTSRIDMTTLGNMALGTQGANFEAHTVLIGLTFFGWHRFDELERSVTQSRLGFMAMKYGRQVTDHLFRDHLKDAVAQTGFELLRLDERPTAGLIDQRMEVEIRRARFLVAELTHGNRGAYWEAGFARGLGKPVFYLCEARRFKRVGTHFDTNHHYTIQWEENNMRAAAEALKTAIRFTLPSEAKLTDDSK